MGEQREYSSNMDARKEREGEVGDERPGKTNGDKVRQLLAQDDYY